DLRTETVEGNLEVKYKICNCGLTLTQKWYTDSTLGREFSLENKLAEGKEKKSGKLKASYEQDCFSPDSNIDIDFSRPTIYGWAMLAFESWFAGYRMKFDSQIQTLHTHMNNGTEFGGSIYQKVNKMIETPINLMWMTSSDDSHFGIRAKYNLDIELLYLMNELTLSALTDGKNFNAGGHRFGLGFELGFE
ncbi:hypothetical protein FD754_020518, partial [Muntiacus muntjak]